MIFTWFAPCLLLIVCTRLALAHINFVTSRMLFPHTQDVICPAGYDRWAYVPLHPVWQNASCTLAGTNPAIGDTSKLQFADHPRTASA